MFTEPCVAISCGGALAQEAALARVGAFGVLADHDEVEVVLTGAGAAEHKRPLVDVQVEVEPHLQQKPALDDAGRHFGGADGAEQERVETAPLVDRLVVENGAVAEVAGTAEVVVDRREVHTGGAHDLQRLRDDFGTDPVAADHSDLRWSWLLPKTEKPPTEVDGRRAHARKPRALLNDDYGVAGAGHRGSV